MANRSATKTKVHSNLRMRMDVSPLRELAGLDSWMQSLKDAVAGAGQKNGLEFPKVKHDCAVTSIDGDISSNPVLLFSPFLWPNLRSEVDFRVRLRFEANPLFSNPEDCSIGKFP